MGLHPLYRPIACVVLTGTLIGCRGPAEAPVSRPQFTEVSAAAGLSFKHDNGAFGKKYYPERMGSGVAFLDANGDGHLDIFLVNGAPLPGYPNPHPRPSRLYLNRGDHTFEDRTRGSGLERIGYGMGVATGDVDNDGDTDLFLTRVGKCSLYLNRGDGTFVDGTEAAGLSCTGYATSAAFLDGDGDGLLDLYVCRYVPWNHPKDDYVCLDAQGKKQYCSVHVYPGLEHRYYRNAGGGRFVDATRTSGIGGHLGRGLAVVCDDYDRDGKPDLFVANDETPNFLWKGLGNGRFEEVAAASGFAYNESGVATAGMGLDVADVDGDGDDDVIESDFQGQRKTLYVGSSQGFFTPNGENKGLGDMPRSRLGFGIGFLDFDLDTWPDVFIANGHVNEMNDPENPYFQTAQLFRNSGQGVYADASEALGEYGRTPYLGRGVAFGDFDNDGDPDILVGNNGGPVVLLRNDLTHRNHWLGIRCIGKRSNRSAFGARVTVTVQGRKQCLEVRSARSYLSSSDPRLQFGLGSASGIEHLTVEWPGGAKQEWGAQSGDRYLTITEGETSLR